MSDETLREIDEAFARLEVLQEAYRRRFPDGRLGPPQDAGRTEDLFCANPLCSVAPVIHSRTGSCPPTDSSTIREILAAEAKAAEEAEDGR